MYRTIKTLMRSLAHQVKQYEDPYTVYPYLLEAHSIFTLIILSLCALLLLYIYCFLNLLISHSRNNIEHIKF